MLSVQPALRVALHLVTHMNFFKRATTSILRRPGKSIILLLLVFILGSVIAGAISIEGAISNTNANLRRNMQPIVSITPDWEAWGNHPDMIAFREETEDWTEEDWEEFDWEAHYERMPSISPLIPEDIRAVGNLDQVRFFDYIASTQLRTLNLNRYEGGEEFSWQPEDWETRHFDVSGTSTEDMVQIDTGIINLVQGRQFATHELNPGSERSVAIVSRNFADHNNLSEGSIFSLYQFVHFPDDTGDTWCWGRDCFTEERLYAEIGMEFEIIGLYEIPENPDADSNEVWERVNRLNMIYVPNWTVEDINRRTTIASMTVWDATDVEPPEWMWVPDLEDMEEHQMEVLSLFLLEDPEDMEDFKEAAMLLLSSEFLRFEERSGGFENISSSMETMQSIANWILYVSIGATLLILSLLITLFLRDRRYEMGVYLALGEKKGKIITQILMEVVVTSFVAISFSVLVGNIISGAVSQNMLRNQLIAEANADDDSWGGGWSWDIFEQIGIPSTDMSIDEMMDQFDVSISLQTIGLFYAVGLGAVVLSTIVPVLYVVTLNPKKVLM